MNRTFFEDLPARKVGGPVVSSGGDKKPAAKSDAASSEGGNTEEKSAKKVRQAVYDIRYRARREGVDLKAAYSQYMGNTTMTGPEKDAVKQKLFGEAYSPIQKQIIANKEETIRKIKGTFEGPHHDKNKHGEPVGEELEEETKGEGPNKKFKIRVTDKASGRTYVRFATREKINSLRANPNIKSVEMTEYGSPYEGEAKKGEQTAATKSGKGLDPVGKEDGDVDNDGDKDKSDKYLLKRRSAIGKAIASRNEEVEQVDEIAPLAAGAALAGLAAAPAIIKKVFKPKVDKALDNATKSNKIPLATGGSQADLRKAKELSNSFEQEGEQIDEFLGPEAAKKADNLMKRVQGGMEKMGIKINRVERGTARPSAKTKETIRQNMQSNEEFTRKESSQFNNWREEFIHEMGDEMDADTEKKVTGMKGKNKVIINPKQGGQS